MGPQPASQTFDVHGNSQSGNAAERVAALIEVVLAFVLVHICYRSFKHFSYLGRQGFLREWTGSVLAGGVIHGLSDVLASVPALVP